MLLRNCRPAAAGAGAARAGMLCRAIAPGAAFLLAGFAHAEPLLVRNQHPLVALFGLPSPLPARLPEPGGASVAATLNWSNFEVTDSRGALAFTLDGEIADWRLRAQRMFGGRSMVLGELAWRRLDGGSLDGLIDDWHSAFSLPGGSRALLPEDALLIEYRTRDAALLRVDGATSGIADVPIAFGYSVYSTDATAVTTWVTIKLPAGNAEDLTGSGSFDAAWSTAAVLQPHDRLELFGQANLAWLGEGDVLPALQESFAWSLLGGASWDATPGLTLTAQFEANSAVFDTGLDHFDGDALVLALGGSYLTRKNWRFDLGLVEDLQPDASPDVTFNLSVSRGFGRRGPDASTAE